MAEIFNNRICVFANELIIFNPKTQVGSEDGFIPEGTYYSMARNGQLIVLRRGIPGCPALVDFETMRKDVKKSTLYVRVIPVRKLLQKRRSLYWKMRLSTAMPPTSFSV